MKNRKNFLKYLGASFIPVMIYAFILLALPIKPSFAFTILSLFAIGLVGQFAFSRYVERND